jgi:putative ABC transport system permease protein
MAGKVSGLELGGTFRFGRRTWRVVGVFDDRGGPASSEIWADVNGVMDDDRRDDYSSVLVPLREGATAEQLIARIDADRRLALRGQRESDYFRAQAGSAEPMRILTLVVALIMGIGAVFGALNTMYASLAGRTREVATLRALGFPPGAIASAFILESMLVAVPAGVLGCLLALPVSGHSTSTLNMMTYAAVSFVPRISPAVIGGGLAFAALIGILGGLWPARSAASVPLAVQLRR